MELNNNNNNNNNSNNKNSNGNNSNNDSDSDSDDSNNNNNNNSSSSSNNNRTEWKIQLIMKNNFISIKDFEDTRSIYSASKPVEIFMGSDTENATDTLLYTILDAIQQAIEASNERGSGFTHESFALVYYYFQSIDIRRAELHIMSPDRIAS